MFCVPSVLKCVFMIYMLEVIQVFAHHKAHNAKFKIDEFIDKLLASKKFDILAEKFAQKAVERMFNLKPHLRFSKDFTAQMKAPENIAFKNVSYKTDVHFGEPSSPLKNLSLKFKYFTKATFYNIHSNENESADIKELQVHNTKNSTDKQKQLASTDGDDESVNVSDLESSLQDKPENTSGNSDNYVYKENKKVLRQNKTLRQENNDGSISVENKKHANLLSENELPEDHKTSESHITGVVSDFDKKVRNDRALFTNESKEIIKDNELKKPRMKRIHREGNRLYTFQSSSEYEEYHQELERVEKERKVFV